jgi:glycosyltransferase involved in cell wall biosynthesis
LIGEGDKLEETRQRAIERGVLDRVEFVDPPAPVEAELHAAQFAIHPSRTEGLSNAILEELAAGLPVIATDVGGTRLLVEDGVNGFVVPPGDEHQLAKRLAELAASPDLRSGMALEARQRVHAFDWRTCTDKYIGLFEAAIAKGAAR